MMTQILLVTETNISRKNHSSKSLWINLDFIIHTTTRVLNTNQNNIAKLLPDFVNVFENAGKIIKKKLSI